MSCELPRVDAIAARDKNGNLWVALTNIGPAQPMSVALGAAHGKFTAASGQTLGAPKIDSVNTFDAPGTVEPKPLVAKAAAGKLIVKLAPASVTVLALE